MKREILYGTGSLNGSVPLSRITTGSLNYCFQMSLMPFYYTAEQIYCFSCILPSIVFKVKTGTDVLREHLQVSKPSLSLTVNAVSRACPEAVEKDSLLQCCACKVLPIFFLWRPQLFIFLSYIQTG